MKATLNFANLDLAKEFIRSWSLKTLRGYDRSAIKENGSFDVTVYDVNECEKQFILDYVKAANS